MSRKTKTTATQEEATPALVPKLRFPEFRKLEEWKVTQLQKIARPVSDRAVTGDADNVLSLSGEHGLVLQSDYFGKKIAGDSAERYLKLVRNDFVYNDRTTKASTFGTIKRLSKYEGGIVSPIYKCFRFHSDENPVFWEWYFESGSHEAALRGLVNEGARAGRFNISISQFLSTAAPRPEKSEQQKIAECLSSVDELIAAQARKLDALKTHKKGLMQQLFPREGETQPRLRFPEFQNAKEWRAMTLGKLIELQSGFAFSSNYFGRKGKKLVTPKNFTKFGFGNFDDTVSKYTTEEVPQKYVCNPGDLLLLLTDLTATCELLGKPLEVAEKDGVVLLNQRVARVELVSNRVTKPFLKQFFLTEAYNKVIVKTAAGSTVRHSSNKIILNMEVVFPLLEEQLRIAACLTTLDDLIAAQTQKLEALKTHKTGLMQQLFPSPEEVEA